MFLISEFFMYTTSSRIHIYTFLKKNSMSAYILECYIFLKDSFPVHKKLDLSLFFIIYFWKIDGHTFYFHNFEKEIIKVIQHLVVLTLK